LGPICDGIIIFNAFYLLLAALHGNQTLGFRFSCFTFYPLRSNETQLNSFLFNALISNTLTSSIIQFNCQELRLYLHKTYVFQLFVKIKNANGFIYFFKYNVFIYATIGVSVLTLLFLLVKSGMRIRFSDDKKKKKKDSEKSLVEVSNE